MLGDADILGKLEKSIEMLASEWAERSDALFVSEFSLQARLFALLWNDEDLWFEISLKPENNVVHLPCVYGEWYAAFGKERDKRFDIALLNKSSVEEWANNVRWQDYYPEKAAKLPVLAAIEIKDEIYAWGSWAEDDINKLIYCMDIGQVQHGYFIIFYPADKPSAAKKIKEITLSRKSLWGSRKIKVCFCPCNSSNMKPTWVT